MEQTPVSAPGPKPVSAPVPPRPTGMAAIRNLEFKVGLLLALTLFLIAAFAIYTLHARGAFQRSQTLVLTAPDAEGVGVGMSMTFSGFPIGQVRRIDLTDQGEARIEIAVPEADARWLRETSVFTLEKPLVGGARVKAYSANLDDPPLPPDAVRPLHTGDVSQEIPILVERVKNILDNVAAMTDGDSSINRTLAHVETVGRRMTGEYGVLEGVLGGPRQAREVVSALERANALLGNLNGVSLRVDQLLAKTDDRVFGAAGTMDQIQQAIAQVNGLLGDTRASLKQADAILANAEKASADVARITGDVRGATADMASLRAEIDNSVRKINHLINEINKKWPFARDVEIKTP